MQNTVAEMSLNSNHVQRRPRIIRNERRHRQFGMHSILSSTVNSRPKGSKSSCVPCKVGAGDELRDVGRWAASSTGTQTATGRPASFFSPSGAHATCTSHRAGITTGQDRQRVALVNMVHGLLWCRPTALDRQVRKTGGRLSARRTGAPRRAAGERRKGVVHDVDDKSYVTVAATRLPRCPLG